MNNRSGPKVSGIGTNEQKENWWSDNKVRTNKYTVLTFIPVNLFGVQFTKVANIYFTIITIMQCFPGISISGGYPAMAVPFAGILIISMLKDAYEDFKRYKEDQVSNNQDVRVYNKTKGAFEIRKWEDVQVGDLLELTSASPYCFCPCDLVILSSQGPEGYSYV
jgi:magnesium-transporting ATPase (P-type)